MLQLVNVQFRKATALANSPNNPRNATHGFNNQRGDILAVNGQVLAQSVRSTSGPYQYTRQYPQGSLFSDFVGYSSTFWGTSGAEFQYNDQLIPHSQPARTLGELLTPPPKAIDNVTLTVEPYLQSAAAQALQNYSGQYKDGAVVVLNPKTGAVETMYSSPSFDPNALSSPDISAEKQAGFADFDRKDSEGFYPGFPMAIFNALAPGSTFKVVTTAAVYNLKPQLSNFNFPVAGCTAPGQVPNTTNVICNDANTPQDASPCGGTLAEMLPASCDPGYAVLGLQLGAQTLAQQASLFGFSSQSPIDLPHASKSTFPPAASLEPPNQPALANSAFGQENVTATTLQMAMVASGIADNGTVMTPHVMSQITNAQGAVAQSYHPSVYSQATSPQAAQQVNKLMQSVVTSPTGTAFGVGFSPTIDAAVKTGTAQVTNPNGMPGTNDWMIGFAPANNPKVAVAVVIPFQAVSSSGAQVAGPIMNSVLQAALNPPAGQ